MRLPQGEETFWNIEASVVHVTKAYDEDSEKVGAPTTRNGVRDVPMPPTLVPLLKSMRAEAVKAAAGKLAPGVVVLPVMAELTEKRRAEWMRTHFKLAELDRARLSEQSPTTMKINFRSWRDTGITCLALAGVDVAKMQRRAGHDEISTTLRYVKMAEDLSGTIGAPFPALPASLFEAPEEPAPVTPDADSPPADTGRITQQVSGEGGIRTRGRLLTCARLASGYLRPLGHLS